MLHAMARSELAAFLSPWPELVKLATLADEVPAAPDADIELLWDESVPASVALRVPADHVPHAFEIEGELSPDRRLAAFVRELEWALNCRGTPPAFAPASSSPCLTSPRPSTRRSAGNPRRPAAR